MQAQPSDMDRPGYIYVLHLRAAAKDKGHPDDQTVFFKVGRTLNVPKRIEQWDKQCPSNIQTMRGYWPFPTDSRMESLIPGCYMPKNAGTLHHKVEELVFIELQDLVVHRQYLDPDFPNIKNNTESASVISFANSISEDKLDHVLDRVKCSCRFLLFVQVVCLFNNR